MGRGAYSRGLRYFGLGSGRLFGGTGRALIRRDTVSQTRFVAHDLIVIKLNISIRCMSGNFSGLTA